MCLAIPAKILKIEKSSALADFSGVTRKIALDLLPDAKTGDYVLVHAGFAINKLDKKEAVKTLRLIHELPEFR
ncbi:MAG: HypC/HybG/HupF family hydrogenase formation chaperone [bacterium]